MNNIIESLKYARKFKNLKFFTGFRILLDLAEGEPKLINHRLII